MQINIISQRLIRKEIRVYVMTLAGTFFCENFKRKSMLLEKIHYNCKYMKKLMSLY